MDIVTRLKEYMAHVGLPSTQLADYAGIPRPTISQILNGRNKKISNELIAKLHDAFPTLNILWLMFGDGEMELKSNIETSEPKIAPISPEKPAQSPANENVKNPDQQVFYDHIQLRNSNIDAFVDENLHTRASIPNLAENSAQFQSPLPPEKDTSKRIKYIMVFYNDNTFEVLTPAP